MGAGTLKKKRELNYRSGNKTMHCLICSHFVKMQIKGIGGEDLGEQGRCQIVGLQQGRMYRILPASVCDQFAGDSVQ